mgnify:CR=1 FL=1
MADEALLKPAANKPAALRALIASGRAIPAPGAFNAITAKIVEDVGFPMIYVSGAGISNGVGGYPDIGFMTATEMAQQAPQMSVPDRPATTASPDLPHVTRREDTGSGVTGGRAVRRSRRAPARTRQRCARRPPPSSASSRRRCGSPFAGRRPARFRLRP